MEKLRRERLKLSFCGNEDIAYIESLEKQIKTLKSDNTLLEREKNALSDDNEMKCELNHDLQKKVDKLACKLAEITEHTPCSSACPIGNPEECDCECNRVEKWKEWAEKDE